MACGCQLNSTTAKSRFIFYKEEDANVNTQSPRGDSSISTLLRRSSYGTSAGQRLTSQYDNVAVLNSTGGKIFVVISCGRIISSSNLHFVQSIKLS